MVQSLKHDGSGAEPGLKDTNGNWDLTPHKSRIQRVDRDVLATWHAVLEDESVPVDQTRMVYTVNKSTAEVLNKLAAAPRIGDLGLQFSAGWHEKNDRTKGYFDSEWGRPESWDSVILQGPHIHVANPFYKSPNPTMKHNQDWTPVDLEALPVDAIPVTEYKPRGDSERYDSAYTHWEVNGHQTSARESFRIAWRKMAANTGERTLISVVVPPGAAHIDGLVSAGSSTEELWDLLLTAGSVSSLLLDAMIRTAPMANIRTSSIERLPVVGSNSDMAGQVLLRVLRLNCLSEAYSRLWANCFDPSFLDDKWTGGVDYSGRPNIGQIDEVWNAGIPFRRASDRYQAQVEIDVLVALSLEVTADELATIYRTQFPVLYGYDHREYLYDVNGRLVPTSIRKVWESYGKPTAREAIPVDQRTLIHPDSGIQYVYSLPFGFLDREVDMRRGYEVFSAKIS